jgi:hypothetical protein
MRRALLFRRQLRARCRASWLARAAAGCSVLLLVAALRPLPVLRDAATRASVTDASLTYPAAYSIIAPLLELLDAIALTTVPQLIAVAVTVLVVGTLAGVLVMRRALGALVGAVTALVSLAALVVWGALAPRPMAKLTLDDPALVAVDVHAHTHASHDGRWRWTADDVRDWHRRSGFHAAYITDHKSYAGAVAGMARNAPRAGDDVVLLSGLELRSWGQHVNVLSMSAGDSVHVTNGDHLRGGMRLAVDGRAPVVVQTIPFNLAKFAGPSTRDSLTPTTALEIHDGAPKGQTMALHRRAELLRLADSLNLALVAGSDHHGWASTATGWTLVSIPGWRALSPAGLAVAFEGALARGRSGSCVVERRTPTLMGAAVVATVPVMLWTTWRATSPLNRASWMGWAWAPLAVRAARRWRARRLVALRRTRVRAVATTG